MQSRAASLLLFFASAHPSTTPLQRFPTSPIDWLVRSAVAIVSLSLGTLARIGRHQLLSHRVVRHRQTIHLIRSLPFSCNSFAYTTPLCHSLTIIRCPRSWLQWIQLMLRDKTQRRLHILSPPRPQRLKLPNQNPLRCYDFARQPSCCLRWLSLPSL